MELSDEELPDFEAVEHLFGDDTQEENKLEEVEVVGNLDVLIFPAVLRYLPPHALVQLANTCGGARDRVNALICMKSTGWFEKWLPELSLEQLEALFLKFGDGAKAAVARCSARTRWDFVNANFVYVVNTGVDAHNLTQDHWWAIIGGVWWPKSAHVVELIRGSDITHTVSWFEQDPTPDGGQGMACVVPLDMPMSALPRWSTAHFLNREFPPGESIKWCLNRDPTARARSIGIALNYLDVHPDERKHVEESYADGPIELLRWAKVDDEPRIWNLDGVSIELAQLLGANDGGEKETIPDEILVVRDGTEGWIGVPTDGDEKFHLVDPDVFLDEGGDASIYQTEPGDIENEADEVRASRRGPH
jgi:hypothetical protein